MKSKKKFFIILLFIIVFVIIGYFWNKNQKSKQDLENRKKMFYIVKKGDIKTEVKVTASAKLANEQSLSFGQEGKILNVNVKVGDEVKAGQILAELNTDDLENSLQTAKLELENAKLRLNKLLYDDTSLRESQLISQINETKYNSSIELIQEDLLKQDLDIKLQQKKDQLEQELKNYQLQKKNLEIIKSGLKINIDLEKEQTENSLINRTQTFNSILNSLNTSIGDIELVIESIDKIYGISKKFKDDNDLYEDFLGVKSTSLKNDTKYNIISSYNFVKKYKNLFENISPKMPDNELYIIIQNYYKESIILENLCDTALDSVDMSIESMGSLSKDMIIGFQNTIQLSRTNTKSIRIELLNLSTSINTLLSNSSQKNQLKLSIEQKELNYKKQELLLANQKDNILILVNEIDNLKKENKNQIQKKKTQNITLLEKIEVLKDELQDVINGADINDINQQKNLVKQAKLRIQKIEDRRDDYQIIAEFDGRVRSIDIVEGEQYELDDRKFIVINNPNLIELELQVNQIDIVKIKKDNKVSITFDAHPNSPIMAKVSNRNLTPELNSRGGIYYKVNIILEKQELEILAGMSALVTITTNEKKGVILIPTLALKQVGNTKTVYKQEGEKYLPHDIKTGIINNFQVEVISGLQVGDIIKASVLDEDTLIEMGIDEGSASLFGN